MAITAEQIIESLQAIADDYFRALQVHDSQTAMDYNEQVREINEQYESMKK